MNDHRDILYFEDPIGVTAGYRRIFDHLSKGLAQNVSLYRVFRKEQILARKGNRVQPGYSFDPVVIHGVLSKYNELVERYKPRITVLTDPALLFLCMLDPDADWDWATIDNLRGGIYVRGGHTIAVTYPLTAWNRDVRERDIAAANEGFSSKEEFDEASVEEGPEESDDEPGDVPEGDGDDSDPDGPAPVEINSRGEATIFWQPIQTKVAVGKFCLESDWAKIHRVLATLKK
jgi:hypothetical protein